MAREALLKREASLLCTHESRSVECACLASTVLESNKRILGNVCPRAAEAETEEEEEEEEEEDLFKANAGRFIRS